jgi:6-phosphogluconolactonase (cycloisomerase 2 family)
VAISPDGRNVYVGSLDSAAVVAFARGAGGGLDPLHGRGGCVQGRPLSSDAGPSCLEHAALNAVASVAVSPDGRSVYALSYGSGALEDSLVALTRDRRTGRLAPVPAGRGGCVVPLGSKRCPVHAAGLRGASAVAVSPDGRFVYVASQLSSAVVAFVRNRATGGLRPVAGAGGCVQDAGTPPPSGDIGCAVKSPALRGARSLALSADGRFAYIASFDPGAVAVLVRNRSTGTLAPLQGSGACLVPTGGSAPTEGACGKVDGLRGAGAVALAPSGRSLYIATISGNSLLRVDRDPVGGGLGASAPMHSIDGLSAPSDLAVPADGRNIYLVSPIDDTVLSLAAAG